MKILSNIAIAITTLILLLFGNGGLALQHCSCSNTTSLLLPFDEGCCNEDSECMTVSIYHLCDSEWGHAEDSVTAPQLETPTPMPTCTAWNNIPSIDKEAYLAKPCFSPPLGTFVPSIIMRV
ncbi:MAG: hypothetical protein K5864_03315 [Bacteroidales bacterium]|nr:hypothetical protein [Bacteroidales bacterium]